MVQKAKSLWFLKALTGLAAVTLCSVASATGQASDSLRFIDIAKFDNDLYTALNASTKSVTVSFYDVTSPNKMPERLQRWISSVEKAGGKIDVEPPPNEPVTRNPLMLFGLLEGLWTALKTFREITDQNLQQAASRRDVVIALDRDGNNQVVVTRVIFVPRAP